MRQTTIVPRLLGTLALTVMTASFGPISTAHGAALLGACCERGGGCQELIEIQCEDIHGDFVGFGVSCASADCAAPVGAPLLSIFGLVAAAGALGGFGVHRLVFRERA
jgi:hypothetical protein